MWGTAYKYDGYLIRITKDEMDSKRAEHEDYIDSLKNELVALAAMSAPASGTVDDGEGNGIPWHEHVALTVSRIVEDMLNTQAELTHIKDAQEALRETPEDVENDI